MAVDAMELPFTPPFYQNEIDGQLVHQKLSSLLVLKCLFPKRRTYGFHVEKIYVRNDVKGDAKFKKKLAEANRFRKLFLD